MTKEEVLLLPPKICTQCNKIKNVSEFFIRMYGEKARAHAECKECTKAAKKRWADKNKDYVLQYARQYYFKDDSIREAANLRRRGKKYPYPPRDPQKEKARKLLRYAIKTGRIVRQPCEVCGEQVTDAHHTDYNKPYDVQWLCKKHHGEQHRKYDEPLIEPRAASRRNGP